MSAPQGSDAWIQERVGVLTGSFAPVVMAGPAGKKTGVFEKAAEILTGSPHKTWAGNAATQRGHDLEPVAAGIYSFRYDRDVYETGLVISDFHELVGASPDRLADDDGGLEIKCLCARDHLRAIAEGPAMPYVHQIWWNIMATGRDWWDYVGYCPDLPGPADFYVKRFDRDEKVIEKYRKAALDFIEKVEEVIQKAGVGI